MKKWLLATDLGLVLVASTQTANRIIIVDMGSLFQRVVQEIGVSNTPEDESEGHASESQRMKTDLQAKMKELQSMKASSDRTKLEKGVMVQRQTFAQKTQAFGQDRAHRSNEKRDRLVTRIQTIVKSVANSQDTDLVINANAVAYNNSDVKNITAGVLERVG